MTSIAATGIITGPGRNSAVRDHTITSANEIPGESRPAERTSGSVVPLLNRLHAARKNRAIPPAGFLEDSAFVTSEKCPRCGCHYRNRIVAIGSSGFIATCARCKAVFPAGTAGKDPGSSGPEESHSSPIPEPARERCGETVREDRS